MADKQSPDKGWIYTDKAVRARLNIYKAMIGVADDSIMDQTATITALLDNAGVPVVNTQRANNGQAHQ